MRQFYQPSVLTAFIPAANFRIYVSYFYMTMDEHLKVLDPLILNPRRPSFAATE